MNVAPNFAFDVPASTAVLVPVAVGLGVMGAFDFARGASLPLGAYTVRPAERANGPACRAGGA